MCFVLYIYLIILIISGAQFQYLSRKKSVSCSFSFTISTSELCETRPRQDKSKFLETRPLANVLGKNVHLKMSWTYFQRHSNKKHIFSTVHKHSLVLNQFKFGLFFTQKLWGDFMCSNLLDAFHLHIPTINSGHQPHSITK